MPRTPKSKYFTPTLPLHIRNRKLLACMMCNTFKYFIWKVNIYLTNHKVNLAWRWSDTVVHLIQHKIKLNVMSKYKSGISDINSRVNLCQRWGENTLHYIKRNILLWVCGFNLEYPRSGPIYILLEWSKNALLHCQHIIVLSWDIFCWLKIFITSYIDQVRLQ
jgi:hypothetical protein